MSRKCIWPSEAIKIDKKFFSKNPNNNWILHVVMADGKELTFPDADWWAISRFGKVQSVVITDSNGKPLYDRPSYFEATNVHLIVWGCDPETNEIKIGVLTEERPIPSNPKNLASNKPLRFLQIPMGFADKGKSAGDYSERIVTAAKRETEEETGYKVIKVERPKYPWHNGSPTFMEGWSNLCFVRVNLQKPKGQKLDEGEAISKVQFVSVAELLRMIKKGKDKEGALFRGCTSLSALMIFFATHPELLIPSPQDSDTGD